MRVTTNVKLIDRQSKYARYATFAGLAILLGSLVSTLVTSNFPILVSYVMLVVGFILAYIGAVLANKWVKEPRPDHALERALKGFDNKNHLYNFVLPSPHVLLAPNGLIVFQVKSHDGMITCQGDKWSRAWQWTRLFGGMGQEPLGNPSAELHDQIAKMNTLVTDKLEGTPVIPIDGYVVFTDPRVQLTVENPTVPVVRVDDLKEALRKAKKGPALPPKLFDRLAEVLDEQAHAKTA